MFSITPLLTGVRNPDQGIMTYQQGYGTRIWLPVWVFLVRGNGHNILVDTGLDENELFVPPEFFAETGMEPDSLLNLLEGEGLGVDDIDIIINTHLHDDHCGNNLLFPHARHLAHPLEIEFCYNPHPLDHRYDTYFIEGLPFEEIEGGKVVEGISVFHSPGHSPGCLSVQVETEEGTAIITGFCCNHKNFPDQGPAVCPGVHLDARDAYASIQRVKALKDGGAIILPMHELGIKAIG